MIICDLEIEIIKKNIKNMHLYVMRPNANIKLSVPYFLSENDIEKFVFSKKDWIVENQKKILKEHQTVRQWKNGEKFYVFDKCYNIEIVKGSKNQLILQNQTAFFCFKQSYTKDEIDNIVSKWNKKLLVSKLSELMPYYEKMLSLECNEWCVRKMKSRWGSCHTQKKKIVFNTKLVEKPIACLQYVVVHEFGHLVYPNHGAMFKEFMTKNFPDWKKVQKILNTKNEI